MSSCAHDTITLPADVEAVVVCAQEDNPRNPSHPAINVKWGELSFDARDEGDIPELRKAIQQKSRVAGMALYMNVVKERFGNMQGNPFDGSNRTK